jgi:hypothetical protein
MSDIWQISHSAHHRRWFDFHPGHLCAVDGVFPSLSVSRLTAMDDLHEKSIPDAGGSQPFIPCCPQTAAPSLIATDQTNKL